MATIGQKLSSAIPHIHQTEPDVEAANGDNGLRLTSSPPTTATGAPRKRKANTEPSATTDDEQIQPLGRSATTPNTKRHSTFRSFGIGKDTSKLQPPPLGECLMNIVKYSWLNLLLLLIPVAWAMEFTHKPDTLIFVFCMLSIIPLAALLGFATEV